jgi:hypothetical protein
MVRRLAHFAFMFALMNYAAVAGLAAAARGDKVWR